jgi:glutamate/tyrosine decarboxylase-like PLP-dependent enzyme
LGAKVEAFDFSVPGVTSISMDFHKYAYCPKGASMVMYRDKELRKPQFFACAEWTGYTVINPTILSSKTGGPLAAAWATINAIGDQGYLEIARRTMEATEKIIKGIESIPELKLLGRPEFCLVAFTSDSVSVFELIDEMKDKAWYVQPQLGFSGSQENIHLSVSAVSLERVEAMLADLKSGVARIKDRPAAGPGNLEDLLAGMDLSGLTGEGLSQMLSLAGIQGGKLPERMATINQLLNTLPAGIKERLLIEYFNELYAQ